jgi:protein-L-isoaspartate(D-aspartate) O-methyltransferase
VIEIDLLGPKHRRVKRDYLARVNDSEFPKYKAAELAKKWGYDFWDGDRSICYGGYEYREGYWTDIAKRFIDIYELKSSSKILEIGCGKGFLLLEIMKLLPGIEVNGLDISDYAISHSPEIIRSNLIQGSAKALPYGDSQFDLAFSLNTFHNLYCPELYLALKEIVRVSKESYICVESYRNEIEKQNLLYWQVTCEAFLTPEEWLWWFDMTGYNRDFGFIYFE